MHGGKGLFENGGWLGVPAIRLLPSRLGWRPGELRGERLLRGPLEAALCKSWGQRGGWRWELTFLSWSEAFCLAPADRT